ncbi:MULTISPECIES: HesA/MoeB/ThiF family protein [unclassified Rhizobium]|uniref:HesA/MoeB/ThiF family protein n=1 Tax=unclassified Rhizobium TaxID=2613769 RepID=UPI001ADC4943|nr:MULTISPECIES: ThiF family adenylyltransferase [unclassified Rhizobium]MBO9126934.1 ThiF family adenylyltransferase [Rhizobium sp. 16-488-2b]MBO9177382.1 ThiF family adenylyltransferase [Rhizobium sp. 16-488-2a]
MNTCEIRITAQMYETLHAHLFPGDHDEHGAILHAGLLDTPAGPVLTVRSVILAQEGRDWVPRTRGYRRLVAPFIMKQARFCRDEKLVYLAVHNHGGSDRVSFSDVDIESHERGFPALLDLVEGMPVGSLVFAPNAIAGDIWFPGRGRLTVDRMVVVGASRRQLRPAPLADTVTFEQRYDRQVRMFGANGQAILGKTRVAIIGLGGVGSVLAELLGRLGVGEFVLVDPDRVQPSNVPRLVDATGLDAMSWLTADGRPGWMRALGSWLATRKIDLARRVILKANSAARIELHFTSMEQTAVAEALKTCDYVFLAADGHRARRLFNALVHQYLVPGVQLGSRIHAEEKTGAIENVHTTSRIVRPDCGCLLCNQAIDRVKLREESVPSAVRRLERYVDAHDAAAPSVITLNALSASQAANDFLFYITGMTMEEAFQGTVQGRPLERRVRFVTPRKDANCLDCGMAKDSRFARGNGAPRPMID